MSHFVVAIPTSCTLSVSLVKFSIMLTHQVLIPIKQACVVRTQPRAVHGYGVISIGSLDTSSSSGCLVPVVTLDLGVGDGVDLQGQTVYVHVTYNVTRPRTVLVLAIDPGTGTWLSSETPRVDHDESERGWQVATYQTTLGRVGIARVAVRVVSGLDDPTPPTDIVEIGSVVVARVGGEWSSMLASS